MTLTQIVKWWVADLKAWRRSRQIPAPPAERTQKVGQWVVFVQDGTLMGRPRFVALSRRGGFRMGRIEWRNQWGSYAFYPDLEGVFNKDLLGEVWALLKELNG